MPDENILDLVERTRAAQGLPRHVEDPAAIAAVAQLLASVSTSVDTRQPPLTATGGRRERCDV